MSRPDPRDRIRSDPSGTGPRRGPRGSRAPRRVLSAVVAVLAMAFLAPPAASALALPTPKAFTSYVDLECFATDAYAPPAVGLTLRHLNPVLGDLPAHAVTLGAREQLCVPVAKNQVIPPDGVAEFVKYVDLSCYRVTGAPVNKPLVLSHLNPVLQDLPRESVTLGAPQQLCVPVAKNGLVPPDEVLALVSHIDLECYAVTPNTLMNRKLALTQLNPVLTGKIPTASVQVTNARRLCVPVHKAGDTIPSEVAQLVRWLDLDMFDVVAPAITPVPLTLKHLNPVLSGLPAEKATLTAARQLGVPVAKNGQFPPG
ncbi:hypothetical protein [Nonomuraea pusilla]|uniref:Uncharacterized protein n=1 Tax=Nonomuraea pusilla TaxID=46177 RepID=A0A1H7ZWM8_9ACTN|nr:hypothetical protein [Nonomuraea pusilla]SEM61707.1 hypothetical protein SAMN05660976_05615 [Nonomuraea pusilla]